MCSCIWLTPPRLAFSSYLRGRPSTNYYIWFNKVVNKVVVVEQKSVTVTDFCSINILAIFNILAGNHEQNDTWGPFQLKTLTPNSILPHYCRRNPLVRHTTPRGCHKIERRNGSGSIEKLFAVIILIAVASGHKKKSYL